MRTLATGGLVVAVDIRFAPDPSWAAAVSDIAVDARNASLIDSVVTVEDATESSLFARSGRAGGPRSVAAWIL